MEDNMLLGSDIRCGVDTRLAYGSPLGTRCGARRLRPIGTYRYLPRYKIVLVFFLLPI